MKICTYFMREKLYKTKTVKSPSAALVVVGGFFVGSSANVKTDQ